jgi:hypothetical protein
VCTFSFLSIFCSFLCLSDNSKDNEVGYKTTFDSQKHRNRI